jgi:hypothetical protein
MRRLFLRGHTNIRKRLLIHIGGFNLELLMRQVIGVGTPRGLQGRVLAVFGAALTLIRALWDRIMCRRASTQRLFTLARIPTTQYDRVHIGDRKLVSPRAVRRTARPCENVEKILSRNASVGLVGFAHFTRGLSPSSFGAHWQVWTDVGVNESRPASNRLLTEARRRRKREARRARAKHYLTLAIRRDAGYRENFWKNFGGPNEASRPRLHGVAIRLAVSGILPKSQSGGLPKWSSGGADKRELYLEVARRAHKGHLKASISVPPMPRHASGGT